MTPQAEIECADLHERLTRAERIIGALVERVEQATDFRATDSDGTNYRNTAFSVFESAVAWEWRVRARTADQHRALNDLAEALAALEHAHAALQREIRERVAAEAALLDAKLLAEQHNAEKTRFLAAVSHDLIQPLNAARLFVGALANQHLPAAGRTLVAQTSSALDSVEDILEALLEIAQLDAGAIRPSIEAIDLDLLLDHLVHEFAPVAHERGLSLTVLSDGAFVASDARLLRRVLQNLISNGLRYTEQGGVEIQVRRRRTGISIEVRDTGVGIARKDRHIIFREFSRLNAHRQGGGAGLGLAIVERAVRTLGHKLTLRSRLGEGSAFCLTLPMAEPVKAQSAAFGYEAQGALSGTCILAVENEKQSRDALRMLLQGWGCIVETALDKSQALAICQGGFRPQLLVVDYHLDKGRTGDQVVRALRARLEDRIPAIIITADRNDGLETKLAAMDCHRLLKPVKSGKLYALVHSLICSNKTTVR